MILNIIDTLGDINEITKSIIIAITSFYDIVKSIFSFIPSPFSDILTAFLLVLIGVIVIKIVGNFL